MSAHTPGPWTCEFGRVVSDAPVFGFSIKAEGRIPAVASAGVATDGHPLIIAPDFRALVTTGFTEEEVEANARLIAAAPDLYEAARHAAMEWRLHGQLTDSCRVLEAAIAKAEGVA